VLLTSEVVDVVDVVLTGAILLCGSGCAVQYNDVCCAVKQRKRWWWEEVVAEREKFETKCLRAGYKYLLFALKGTALMKPRILPHCLFTQDAVGGVEESGIKDYIRAW